MSDQLRLIERVNELLAGIATGGLTGEESVELQQSLETLRNAGFDVSTIESYETLAASVAVGVERSGEQLPPALRALLLSQGRALVGAMGSGDTARPVIASDAVRRPLPAARPSKMSMWSGWAAAAAALLLAAIGWLRTPPPTAVSAPAPAWVQRQELLQNHTDTSVFAFTPTDDPVGKTLAGGDVVWNQRLQRGFLRFKSLAQNDPTREQYQLWIFDPGRPAEYPVDGGLFDNRAALVDPATGDIVIPVDPRVLVRDNPAAFAVTVEQAGGVVVTDRKRVFALAPTAKPAPKPN